MSPSVTSSSLLRGLDLRGRWLVAAVLLALHWVVPGGLQPVWAAPTAVLDYASDPAPLCPGSLPRALPQIAHLESDASERRAIGFLLDDHALAVFAAPRSTPADSAAPLFRPQPAAGAATRFFNARAPPTADA